MGPARSRDRGQCRRARWALPHNNDRLGAQRSARQGKEKPLDTKTKLQNFVGGEHVDPADGTLYDLINPATGEVFARAPMSGREDVDRAFEAAENAFEV